jgi:hypothetical protein
MTTRRHTTRRPCVEELEGRLVPAAPSINWAGYAVQAGAGAVRAVRGTWIVPAVSGASDAVSSAWVGIDGNASPTVEQIGTESDILGGMPVYFAWFEMFPRDRVIVGGLAIHPGDVMTGVVTSLGSGLFRLRLTDFSTGQSFATTQAAPAAQRSSAEWVVERPGHEALADFGTVPFFGASLTAGSRAGPIDRVRRQVRQIGLEPPFGGRATPSGLTDSGVGRHRTSSFTVTFDPPAG